MVDAPETTTALQRLDPQTYELERLKLRFGFLKFALGTVLLGTVSLVVNSCYQSRQIELEELRARHEIEAQEAAAELEYLHRFMDNAMSIDLQEQVKFARYVKSVALSDEIRTKWDQYHLLLDTELQDLQGRATAKARARAEQEAKLAKAEAGKELNAEEIHVALDEVEQLHDEELRLYRAIDRSYAQDLERRWRSPRDPLAARRDALLSAGLEGNFDEQLEILHRALRDDPSSAEVLLEIATVHRSRRDYQLALEYANRARAAEPERPGIDYVLAIHQKNAGRLDEAVRSLDNAIQNDPGDLTPTLAKAGYRCLGGDRTAGRELFETIESLVGGPPFASNVAWYHAACGQDDEFYPALERALRLAASPKILIWIAYEVDFDRYRGSERFEELVAEYRTRLDQGRG